MTIQTLQSDGKLNYLQKKILMTLGFLAIYRMGVYVPIPGVDSAALKAFFTSSGANLFGMFNMFSGGALQQFSIFALGVAPYISASIISQLLTVAVPHLEALSKEGEAGRKKITQYTRYGTVVLALIQGFMLTSVLMNAAPGGKPLVLEATMSWRMLTVLSLTAGTAFVMWLGEQITEKGVGNGISLIIFASIVATLPNVIANTYSQVANAQMHLWLVIILAVICVGIVAGVVFIEQGQREVPIQYAKRQIGRKIYGGQSSYLPIRVNTAGVIPPIFAGALLQFPMILPSLKPDMFGFIGRFFPPGGWLYNVVFVTLIVFFAFFYTSIVFKPDDVAENLKRNNGSIPGVRPGTDTSSYFQRILSRLTLVGGIYLAAICITPSIIMSSFNVPFYFGGTSLLIVVGVALETFRQIDAHRQSLRYDSFVKRGTVKPRRR